MSASGVKEGGRWRVAVEKKGERTHFRIIGLRLRGASWPRGQSHIHGLETPVADGLQLELHGFLLPEAAETLGIDVRLVHEDVAAAIVARHETCAGGVGGGSRA